MELTVQAPTTPVKPISPRPQRDRKPPVKMKDYVQY